MNFPLTYSFKIVALAPQIRMKDADGKMIGYVRQKIMRIKEQVEVFTSERREQKLAHIQANKILDWSARYTITDASGEEIGAVGRRGMRSLWRAHYEVFHPEEQEAAFSIREEKPWTKVLDGFISELPFIGMFSGYFLHPSYIACRADGTPVMRLQKQPAFFEGKFSLEKLGELNAQEELSLACSFLMLNLLERRRG